MIPVREKSDNCDIHHPIPVEIPGHRLITPVDRIKISLSELIMTIILVNIYAMIRLQHRRKIRIVPARIKDVCISIPVEIRQFEGGRTIGRREPQDNLLAELS